MLVEKITTKNFRNLVTADISFSPGVNLFIGENGHGKTNFLEAISFFKLGRSFRANRDAELIHFNETFCRIEVQCRHKTGDEERFSVAIDRSGRKILKTNGQKISKLSELIGRYPVVMFGPRDLGLISGPPGERRRFVDMVGSMTDRSYVYLLKNYRRVLDQRNAALKARAGTDEREAWNTELIEKGSELISRRKKVAKKIEGYLKSHSEELDAPFRFTLGYISALCSDKETEPGPAELKEIFEKKLKEAENEELRRCTTMVGPHRDDIKINMNGRGLKKYGSQGQKRLFSILAKLSEQTHVETELGEPCVLMLDDVFSEFDKEITAKLQKVFEGGRQVFVTSPISLDWEQSRAARVFNITAGRPTS